MQSGKVDGMTRTIRIFVAAAGVVALTMTALNAKPSVRYMRPSGLGLEYSFLARGQFITDAAIGSHEISQHAMLYYSPTQIVQLGLGGGVERLRVDEYQNTQFKGAFGFSPCAGVWLNTPAFFEKVMRITAGFTYMYLNSVDGDYRYSGPILNPSGGLLFHAGRFLDIEAGVKGHFLVGAMENDNAGSSSSFSNKQNLRIYSSFTLCAPNGAYAGLYFDASPDITENWKYGPSEAALGFSIGTMLWPHSKTDYAKGIDSKVFPEYKNLRKRQRQMAREIED
jgi:hypothetical protein